MTDKIAPTPRATAAENKLDRHIGSRIRLRRTLKEMSQDDLAEQIGVTFQMVQKYEKGVARVAASRLSMIADALDVPVSFFFDDMEDGKPRQTADGMSIADARTAALIAELEPSVANAFRILARAASARGEA